MIANLLRYRCVEHFLEGIDDQLASAFLVAALEVTEANAREIFDPLKVGNRDTAGVHVGVGDDDCSLFAEDFVGGKGDRAVGCLGNERRLDVGGVALIDHTLEGGGNENVAVGLEQGGAVLGVFGTGETFHSTVFINVLFDRLDVEPIGGADGAVTLDDGDDLCAVFFAEKFSGVIADVA